MVKMENDMKIEFTTEDAKELSHTICQSFYHGREGEFEMLHKNDDVPSNDQQLMYFYAFQLEALLSYKAFLKNDPNTAMVVREVEPYVKDKKIIIRQFEYIVITQGTMGLPKTKNSRAYKRNF
tara:strand:+ start:748 stop:1116 length:369 start_codon:yes stop_codon:yes gene_type:complete